MNAIKNYFESYYEEVTKPTREWNHKHWKGNIIWGSVLTAACLGIAYSPAIIEKAKDKFKSKKNND